jgi:DNA segregation ATPase FtsK/SpoIIIE, S-DNA-T family
MKTCPECKHSNDDTSLYCMNCGFVLGDHSKTQSGFNPASVAKTTLNRYEDDVRRAKSGFDKDLAKINQRFVTGMVEAKDLYDGKCSIYIQHLNEINRNLGLSSADWQCPIWQQFTTAPNHMIPAGIRFATAFFKGIFGGFQAPALVPMLNQGNVFFLAKGPHKKRAVQALQSSLFRVVSTFPPGKLRLTLIDPVGLGANVSGFMNLPENIIGNKAWTEPQHIEQQLADLSAHMENVIQKYLRNDYRSMEEYNRHAGEVAEPYRFLGVINFPANFTDSAAKRLVSIASNGPKAGVYLIGSVDGDLPLPYGFNLADLLRTGSTIEANESGEFTWKVTELDKLGLSLDTPPQTDFFNRIINIIGQKALQNDRVEVPFEKVMIPRNDWWKGNTGMDISVPIGRRGARDIQSYELGGGMQHYGLMAGKPGSGKSTLLHVLITNLALKYSPEELILFLVDFKKGVEFKDYAVFKLPHARVIGIESEREFGLSVLKEVEQELDRRGDLFRNANYQDLHTYREKTKDRLPRVFLIIDEFQRLFSEDDPLADQASHILAHIVQQGRAFGVHILLASQSLADAYAVGRATYDKMNVRIALQCTEADSRLILGEENGAARLLSRPGEAVYNALNGREEGNSFFQVAWLPDEKREVYLRQIEERAKLSGYNPEVPQVIFEGNVPSLISSNKKLWERIYFPKWTETKGNPEVFLGESTEINPPHTTLKFSQQGRSNLLILGQGEKAAFSILSSICLSLCADIKPELIKFFVADFSRADDPWAATLPKLKSSLPFDIEMRRPREFLETLEEVRCIVDERIQHNNPTFQQIFFFLAGLHRARELRETDRYGDIGEAAQKLAYVCREGPDVNVHIVGWCDTYANLTRCLDRRTVSEFDLRVALQMGEDDSNQFIESPKAAGLGANRAYFYDVDRIGRIEKFRPYELIAEMEYEKLICGFRKKA